MCHKKGSERHKPIILPDNFRQKAFRADRFIISLSFFVTHWELGDRQVIEQETPERE